MAGGGKELGGGRRECERLGFLRSALLLVVLALSAGIGAKSHRWPFVHSDRVLRAGRQAIVWDKNNQGVKVSVLEKPGAKDVEVVRAVQIPLLIWDMVWNTGRGGLSLSALLSWEHKKKKDDRWGKTGIGFQLVPTATAVAAAAAVLLRQRP